MSANQFLVDASTRHQVFLQRFGGGQSKEAQAVLDRIRRTINARLSQEPTQFQAQRLQDVLADIDQIWVTGFTDMSTGIREGAHRLASQEAQFSVDLYDRVGTASFNLPAESALIAAVEAAPMQTPVGLSTLTIDDALAQFGTKKGVEIANAIRDGLVLGDTSSKIASSVNGLMNTKQRRHLDTLVRTITNHASSVAREQVYQENERFLDGYRYIATLDSRTTLICASLDNKVFEVGVGPMPPQHWNCRSTTVPVVNPAFSVASGLTGKRASVEGPVSANTSYGGWLRKQPVEFVDEALGVERSRLFRSGRLTIDKFVDPTGRVYTLDQLRDMNPFVFQEI
jgi:SPP1 gp7 family putative phage head morphogenesis protein